MWVAVFPDTIEKWLGVGYGFAGYWGVSRMRFEAFTFGTLAVILLIAVIGYLLGRPVRARQVVVPLELPLATAGVAVRGDAF